MSPYAADRRIAEAGRSDPDALRAAVEALADLEVSTRTHPAPQEDTAAVRTILRISAGA